MVKLFVVVLNIFVTIKGVNKLGLSWAMLETVDEDEVKVRS